MSWLAVQLRRLADARSATAGLMFLALATAFLFAAAPRVIDAQADHALTTTVRDATSDARNIAVSQNGRIAPSTPDLQSSDPPADVTAAGDRLYEQFPASIAALVKARYTMIETPRFRPAGIEAHTIRLRYLQAATDHVRFVSGRAPAGRTTAADTSPNTVEIALSTTSAADMGVAVGDTIQLLTDETDKLAVVSVASIAVTVVGLYDVIDGEDDYWFSDTTLERPQIRSITPTNQIFDVTALMAADAYSGLYFATATSGLPMRYTWRFQVDASRLAAGSPDVLTADMRRMESVFIAGDFGPTNQQSFPQRLSGPALQSGLRLLLESYALGWRAVTQILSVAEVGCGAVALLALALVCLLAGRRRTPSLVMWRNRGASRFRSVGGTLVDTVLELGLPAAAGTLLAVVLIPARSDAASVEAAGAIVVMGATLMTAAAFSGSRDPATSWNGGSGGAAEGDLGGGAPRGSGQRRLVLEGFVVAGALAGVFLLRQRGVGGGSGLTGTNAVFGGPDPLLAAVPALVGAAAALLVARLLPVPLNFLTRLVGRGRGLVAMLALRRAGRRSGNRMVLTALLAMAGLWSYAAVSLAYLDRASDTSSWQSVGASYRIALSQSNLPADLDLTAVKGVDRVSDATAMSAYSLTLSASIPMLALDLASYHDVIADGPLDDVLPKPMIEAEIPAPATAGVPTAGKPVPAIVSTVAAQELKLHVDDAFQLGVGDAKPRFTVVAIRDVFPTLAADAAWVVVPRGNLAAATGSAIAPTEAFIKARPAAADGLAKELHDRLPGQGSLTSRYEVMSELRSAVEYGAVVFGLTAVSLIAAAYGTLAILLSLLLVGAEKSRESAHLRIMGLSRAEDLGLSALEHGPTSLLVVGIGIALGLGLFRFLQPSLGLGGLVGGDIDVGLPIEPASVAGILIAIGAIVALAVILETIAQSIIKPTAALRRGLD
ncbi:MAG TPA: hypothetical protein VF337_12430 [Candidatus Limnocylindrales bacterium]